MNNEDHTPNTGDKISTALEQAAEISDALSQEGVKTGKASFWLRVGSALASFGATLFGKKK